MQVLYISYDGMTDPLGQSQVIPYLTSLSKMGYTITLISCEKKDRFQKQKEQIQLQMNSAKIHWIPVPYSTLPSIISKQLNLFRIKQKAFQYCTKNNVTIIHCRSYMASLIGLKLKKKFGTKFIFDMRGFWADERIDGKIWNIKNPLHKKLYSYFKKKEIEFIKNADYTISLTENAKQEILSWESLQSSTIPIQVIPCCADLALFSKRQLDPSKLNELKYKLKIQDSDFILSYLGSIGTWYMLDEMLDFYKQLLLKKNDAVFLFITPDDPTTIIKKAKQKDIPIGKIIIQSASRKEVPYYLSLSKISIYFIKPLYSKKASSPTKTAEIMGLGIPIISNSGIGDSDKIIEDAKAGKMINSFDTNEYDRIINQIDVLLQLDEHQIIAAAEKYFSLQTGAELYNQVYKKLSS